MFFKNLLFLAAILAIFSASICPAIAVDYSRYDFVFNYEDGSGDKYLGYVFAPTNFQTSGPGLVVGKELHYQPESMGGAEMGGYYYITAITNGFEASYDGQEYVTAYYDGKTGKTSFSLYDSAGQNQEAATSLYVADRRVTAEVGFVYDPSLLDSYAYTGSPVCYEFNTSGSSQADFLEYAAYAYSFEASYGSGDYYTGYVFAAEDFGYFVGYSQNFTDENGQTGTYAISGVYTDTVYDGAIFGGKVFVLNYFDSQSSQTYTPINSTTVLGTNYLGSEAGYIIQPDWAEYRFGGGFEADVASDYSRVDFIYYYSNNSGDYFSGYFYAPSGEYSYGDIPVEMTEGLYLVIQITPGYGEENYNGQEYVTAYYDGGSQKSVPLELSFGIFAGTEYGVIYDPSVPETDPYYGNSKVVYSWTSSSSVDFLVVYYSGLPYWTQPEEYPNSCAVVAGAIYLAWWDQQPGYENMIPEDWSDWTTSSPEYVSFIGELAELMEWTSAGVYEFNMLSGIVSYVEKAGYDTYFAYRYLYPEWKTSYLPEMLAFLDQIPLLGTVFWGDTTLLYHEVVVRGYWSSGQLVANFGWGSYYLNQKIDFFNLEGSSYRDSVVESYTGFIFQ